MTSQLTTQERELAQRTSDGIEVTLVWVHGDGDDRVVVSVYDSRDGSSFEIPAPKRGWHSIEVSGAPPIQFAPAP